MHVECGKDQSGRLAAVTVVLDQSVKSTYALPRMIVEGLGELKTLPTAERQAGAASVQVGDRLIEHVRVTEYGRVQGLTHVLGDVICEVLAVAARPYVDNP